MGNHTTRTSVPTFLFGDSKLLIKYVHYFVIQQQAEVHEWQTCIIHTTVLSDYTHTLSCRLSPFFSLAVFQFSWISLRTAKWATMNILKFLDSYREMVISYQARWYIFIYVASDLVLWHASIEGRSEQRPLIGRVNWESRCRLFYVAYPSRYSNGYEVLRQNVIYVVLAIDQSALAPHRHHDADSEVVRITDSDSSDITWLLLDRLPRMHILV